MRPAFITRFRYYDPEGGMYVSQDPIGIQGGLRAHGYVFDPLAYVDPLGLKACSTWNEFQRANPGKFKSRKEASAGWRVYKQTSASREELAIERLVDTEAAESRYFTESSATAVSRLYPCRSSHDAPVTMTMTKPDLSQCCTLLAAALDADATANPAGAALALRSFLQSFLALDESERAEIRSVLQPPEARKIAGLGVVAAEEALAQRAPEWLKWSLLAHDVEQFQDDPRNNYPLLAVTAYAAQQLDLEPRQLFEELALAMSARSQSYIRMFAARSPELNSLAAMCVRVASEAGRMRFHFD